MPTGAAYGSHAGLPLILQFNGFGHLYGIPGFSVDASTNAHVECNVPNARYVPLFSIPDGALVPRPAPACR